MACKKSIKPLDTLVEFLQGARFRMTYDREIDSIWHSARLMIYRSTDGELNMRKIVAAEFITLDGVYEAPGSEDTTLPKKRGVDAVRE